MLNSFLHYEVIEKLGEGGMGVVYLAHDTKLNRKVALKFLSRRISLDSVEKERFLQEARAAASLNHPHIAQVYAIEEVGDEVFIVMEYINGKELRTVINEAELNLGEKKSIAIQIAEGLQAAQNKGIIHRDIKSGNIMLAANNSVKIMDFGLARIEGAPQITKTGTTIGTVSYMSPEQLKNNQVDKRSDIWAYGVVLYELFTGLLPFQGIYEAAIMYAITEEAPVPPSNVTESIPEEIEAIIELCLKKDPDVRYQDFGEILHDLKGTSPKKVKSVEHEKKATKPKFGKYLYVALPFVLLLLLIIFLPIRLYFGWESSEGMPLPEERGLAILPFKNISTPSEELEALSDGLMMNVTSRLTQVSNYKGALWVISASEIIQEGVTSPGQARKDYSVNLVVTGNIQKLEDRIQLTMNLIDTKSLRQLMSREINSEDNSISVLQTRVFEELLDMLNIELQPEVTDVVIEGNYNNRSSQHYIQGQGYLLRYEKGDNLDKAIRHFQQAVDDDSDHALAYAALGEGLWRKYQDTEEVVYVDQAKNALAKAMKINSDLVQVISTLGLINRGTGDYDQAIENFQEVIIREPNNAMAFRQLAGTYVEKGELDRAEANYMVAIKLKPDYWRGYSDLGNFYLRYRGDINKAEEQYQQVLALTPENYIGLSGLGVINIYRENFELAINFLEQSMSIRETYFAASNLGVAYYYMGNYSEAIHWYSTAYELNSSAYLVLGNIASAHEAIGNDDLAVNYYKKAIAVAKKQLEVNPNEVRIINSLGSYYADIGENREALQYLKRSLALDSNNNEILFYTSAAYERMGNREKALEWIEQAMSKGYPVSNIINQPELYSMTSDARFKKMIKKYEE